jgi:sulfite reductase alpha subunit-like flavoprotein
MKATVVRYKTKDGTREENERLIKDVFRELEAKSPDGLRYIVLKLGDGSFLHFVMVETSAAANPLRQLEAFRAFQSGVAERCADPPQSADATIVGNYRMAG